MQGKVKEGSRSLEPAIVVENRAPTPPLVVVFFVSHPRACPFEARADGRKAMAVSPMGRPVGLVGWGLCRQLFFFILFGLTEFQFCVFFVDLGIICEGSISIVQ